MDIYLARTQGFCAGVASAINIVDQALNKFGAPLYVYHEIVHNTYVVNDFCRRGVIFVDDILDVPVGQRVIFSAHGIPPSVLEMAKDRKLECIDATCPIVKKVHREARNYSDRNYHVVLIGHKGHQEVIGTAGYVKPELLHVVQNEKDIETLSMAPTAPVAFLTQTTLSIDETKDMIQKLRKKFPQIQGPAKADICYATQQRQDAVKELAGMVELILVCGSPNSSNSNRLRETGEKAGIPSFIVDNAGELDLALLKGKKTIGISSGASVPECIVHQVISKIQKAWPESRVQALGQLSDNPCFPLPHF